MQMIVYFSTLEIHDGSTACEISISWNMDAPVCLRVHNGTVFTLIVILHAALFPVRFMHSL